MSKTARPAHQGAVQQPLVSKTDPPAHQGAVQHALVSKTALPAHQGTVPQPLVSKTSRPAHQGTVQHALVSKTARPAHQGAVPQPLVSKTDPPAHQGAVPQPLVSKTALPAHQGTAQQALVSQTALPAHHGTVPQPLVSKTDPPAHGEAVPQHLVSQTARPAHEGAYSLSQTYPSAGRCPSDVVAAGSSWKIFSIRPLLGRGHGGVAALEAGDVGFPICLAGQGGETGVVLDEIEVICGVHDHEDPAFKAVDLHVKDADGTDTLLNLRPNVPVSLNVALNHLAVPNQLKCLRITFHYYLRS